MVSTRTSNKADFGAGCPVQMGWLSERGRSVSRPLERVPKHSLASSSVIPKVTQKAPCSFLDGHVESEITPIVTFMINRLNDPVMLDIDGDCS